ncbi:MAG: hypothetical protein ACE5JQ_15700 [Candidatus Methylomirabilales bacterium]
MDSIQEQHERAVGDAFIEWYNNWNGTKFRYHGRGADPPDLVYRSESEETFLEITVAYYDANNAAMLWQNARRVQGAANIWIGKNPDQKIIEHVNAVLTEKCGKQYPPKCVLVVGVYPDVTAAEELDALIGQIKVPVDHPFVEIYLAGNFPSSSGGSGGGYYCWKLGIAARQA